MEFFLISATIERDNIFFSKTVFFVLKLSHFFCFTCPQDTECFMMRRKNERREIRKMQNNQRNNVFRVFGWKKLFISSVLWKVSEGSQTQYLLNMDGKFSLKRKCTHWHTLSSTHTRAQTRLFIPSLSLSQTVPLFHTHARTHAHARCSAAVEWTHLSIHPAQSKRWVRERESEWERERERER